RAARGHRQARAEGVVEHPPQDDGEEAGGTLSRPGGSHRGPGGIPRRRKQGTVHPQGGACRHPRKLRGPIQCRVVEEAPFAWHPWLLWTLRPPLPNLSHLWLAADGRGRPWAERPHADGVLCYQRDYAEDVPVP